MQSSPVVHEKGIHPLKNKPIIPDWSLIHSKGDNTYLHHLYDIAYSLKILFPDQKTSNPHHELAAQIKGKLELVDKEKVILFTTLVEGLTKLNHPYRLKEDDNWLTEREDVILATRLLQPLIWPESLMSRASKRIYQELVKEFYPKDYTIRAAVFKLRIPKSTLKRHFTILEKGKYIERVGGDKKQGYLYNVGSRKL